MFITEMVIKKKSLENIKCLLQSAKNYLNFSFLTRCHAFSLHDFNIFILKYFSSSNENELDILIKITKIMKKEKLIEKQ